MTEKNKLIAEALPPHCGYPWKGSFHAGCGCGKEFQSWNEVYRCADCGIPMHRRCLIEHFGDGRTREVEGYGKVQAPQHTPHHFAEQVAWLATEVTARDLKIAQLRDRISPPTET